MLTCTILPIILLVSTTTFSTAVDKNVTADISTRIIGGRDVRDGEVPYQILLEMPNDLCGGALIKVNGKQAVLTAAHCVLPPKQPSDIKLVAGNVRLRDHSSHEQIRSVTRIIFHAYNDRTQENDIAILALDRPFQGNQYVKPIPLPSQNQESSGDALASGWGKTWLLERQSSNLKSLTVTIIPQFWCQVAHRHIARTIYNSMLCAGGGGARGVCHGDSGGPLKAQNGNYLAGIASWVKIGCGRPLFPDVYTKVSHYVDWIQANVRRL